jgi:hypothetical protein
MEQEEEEEKEPARNHEARRGDFLKIHPQASAMIDSARIADCRKCVCFPVCTIIRNFAPMTFQLFPKDEKATEAQYADSIPVNPYDLAKICKKYLPESEILTR